MSVYIFLSTSFFALLITYFLPKLRWFKYQVIQSQNWELIKHVSNGSKYPRIKPFPFSFPLLNGLYYMYQFRKNGVRASEEWTKNMGDNTIAELSFGSFQALVCTDPLILHKLLTSSNPAHLSRPRSIYCFLLVGKLMEGLLTTEYQRWTMQRKVAARAFTFRSHLSYLKIMNRHSKSLARTLLEICDENGNDAISGPVLYDTIHSNTVKITLEFVMGSEFADTDLATQFSRDMWDHKEICVYRFQHPELYIPPLWWLHPKRREAAKLSKKVDSFLSKVIEQYQQRDNDREMEETEQKCLIQEMLNQNVSIKEIDAAIATFLAAGHETITSAMKFLLQHLACQPEIQIRCREEVDKVIGDHWDLSTGFNLSIGDLSRLEYLERVILESLRIAPTVPFTLREINGPLKIDNDRSFQKGQIVIASAWVIHHNPKYYPNPEQFDPDRFLPEQIKKRGPGTYFPFSLGLRACIGKRFAMMQMKTTFAWILRNFEIYSEDGMDDVKVLFEVTLRPERDYRIILKKRRKLNACM